MKKILLIFLIPIVGISQTPLPISGLTPTANGNDNHWVLQWTDDFRSFTSPHLNPSDNTYWVGTNSTDHRWQVSHNANAGNSPQVFIKDQITFNPQNGLVITTQKLTAPYSCPTCTLHTSFNYASGNVTRWDDFPTDVQYGYIEAYIKIEKDVFGLWPAFWLWKDKPIGNCSTPYNCTCNTIAGNPPNFDYDEIDIFELTPGAKELCPNSGFYNTVQNKFITRTNIHTCLPVEQCGASDHRGMNLTVPGTNGYLDWHWYGIEWTPSKIIYYIDRVAIRTSPNPGYPNPNGRGDISQKLAIILGSGLNDNVSWPNTFWGNSPQERYNNGSTAYFNSSTYSPADINSVSTKMYVMYANYWKLNIPSNDCSLLQNYSISSSNINNFDNTVGRNFSTSGLINLMSSKIWRASESITINADFYSNGQELYLDVNPCIQ